MNWRGENGETGERDLGWEGRGGERDGEEKRMVRAKATHKSTDYVGGIGLGYSAFPPSVYPTRSAII